MAAVIKLASFFISSLLHTLSLGSDVVACVCVCYEWVSSVFSDLCNSLLPILPQYNFSWYNSAKENLFLWYLWYILLICSLLSRRSPTPSSDPGADFGFCPLLAFSSLLQTDHHFLFILLIQPRCMLGRWPTGAPSSLQPPRRSGDGRNL